MNSIPNTEYTIRSYLRTDQQGNAQIGFGITEERIGYIGIYILCSERNKAGRLTYPDRYYITREEALKCLPKKLDDGPVVLTIPLEKCSISPRNK